jgi:hypothetical protein
LKSDPQPLQVDVRHPLGLLSAADHLGHKREISLSGEGRIALDLGATIATMPGKIVPAYRSTWPLYACASTSSAAEHLQAVHAVARRNPPTF